MQEKHIKTQPAWSAPSIQTISNGAESVVEDSPVKSLRKWVDGCFHNNSAPVPVSTTSQACLTDTPPATPPHRTSTECPVITAGKIV